MRALHMVPAFATAGGLPFARALRPHIETFSQNILGATERGRDDSGGSTFHTQPAKLDGALFETTAKTIGEARATLSEFRRTKIPITHDEFEFFRGLLKGTADTLETLCRSVEKSQTSRRLPYEDPWIFCDAKAPQRRKAHVTFSHYLPQAPFFGLSLAGVVESALLAAGLELEPSYERNIADQVGLGVVTALRVYEGLASLVDPKERLLPHKAYRVEDVLADRETKDSSARFYVASRYLPILYP